MRPVDGHQTGFDESQLVHLRNVIRQRLTERITVAELAQEVGMSASCFARLFKRAAAQTPHAYILRERVARAAEILAERNGTSLAQIALQSGFADQAHLTRVFRRIMQQTPASYCRSLDRQPRQTDGAIRQPEPGV